MLCGNLLTYGMKYDQSGTGSPRFRLCNSSYESISHIVTSCPLYSDIRAKILTEFSETISKSQNCLDISYLSSSENTLTQLVLDPSSMNLPNRVHVSDPILPELFTLSRDLCFAICKRRSRLISEILNKPDEK